MFVPRSRVGLPKKLAASERTATEGEGRAVEGRRVYLGESGIQVYLAFPETAGLKQVPWNSDIWSVDVRDLIAEDLAAIRRGKAPTSATGTRP